MSFPIFGLHFSTIYSAGYMASGYCVHGLPFNNTFICEKCQIEVEKIMKALNK